MKKPTKEEYEAMTPEEKNYWFIMVQRMHQTMWGINPHNTEWFDQRTVEASVKEIVSFFGLPMPKIQETGNTITKISTGDDGQESEFLYNLKTMQDKGVNNLDALQLCIAHELCHQALRDTLFCIFPNELWIQELACDIAAGAYAEKYFLATNKYKWVINIKKATPTHPEGKLRELAVDYGRENFPKIAVNEDSPLLDRILSLVPPFVYEHMMELAKSWKMVEELDWEKTFFNPPPPQPLDIDSLPDTNLIKQAVLKHRAQLKEKEK